MASIATIAKTYKQPEGGFLSITKFKQCPGSTGYMYPEERKCDISDFISRYFKHKESLFPEPYDTFERSLKLLRRIIVTIINCEGIIENPENCFDSIFERALKGANNKNETENANRLLENIKHSCSWYNMLDSALSTPDLLDIEIIEDIINLISYEYFANKRSNKAHIDFHIPEELYNYIYDVVLSIEETCIHGINHPGTTETTPPPPIKPIIWCDNVSSFPKMSGAYNEIVSRSNFDFLSYSTLWKLFLSNSKKPKPTTSETLELLMQYIMLINVNPEFEDRIDSLGIYDPNNNIEYIISIADIPKSTIETVYSDVIGY